MFRSRYFSTEHAVDSAWICGWEDGPLGSNVEDLIMCRGKNVNCGSKDLNKWFMVSQGRVNLDP